MFIQSIHAALQQVTGIEIIVGGHLEQLAPSLRDDEIVVWLQADVAWLTDIPDPGVPLPVVTANVRGAVGGSVVRNDQLEVLIGLAEQSLQRLGEQVPSVIDRKPETQPGNCAHVPPAGGAAARTGTGPAKL